MKISNICSRVITLVIIATYLATFFSSCKKYLEAKPDQKLAVPSTLLDLEMMLDNYGTLNSRYRAIGEIAADNYYLTDGGWSGALESNRNYYLWQAWDDVGSDWSTPYNTIIYTNIILEALDKIKVSENSEQIRKDNIEGCALFFRALNYYDVAQLFCKPYNRTTSTQDLGLPIKLNSNLNEKSYRSSVQEVYDRIIEDLRLSLKLLPDTTLLKYRPSRAAVFGLLARTYLSMREYSKAGSYADSCLMLHSQLMNYNSSPFVDPTNPTIPIKQWNPEIIFDAQSSLPPALARTRAKVDTGLYKSYDSNDIRKEAYFRANSDGSFHFKGNYTGSSSYYLFVGIAADEIYLIRAESYAREGNLLLALDDLNTLLENRWKGGAFVPYSTSNADSALSKILSERRKELLFRGLRWSDLRRLNTEPNFAVILQRKINSQTYELLPNGERYVFLIDRDAIRLGGIEQNP